MTFVNISDRSLAAGFTVDILDAAGRRVTARSTAVQLATPGETVTVSSEGTAGGPSGVPCPSGGRTCLTDMLVL